MRSLPFVQCLIFAFSFVQSKIVKWNQTANYVIEVDTTDWSNYYGENGGCVTCPYTCVKPTIAPDGMKINGSNATQAQNLPSIYTQTKSNGCCYAAPSESKKMPSCESEANPSTAEACGFLYGPTLKWRIGDSSKPGNKSVIAILFASVDCESFWAVGYAPVRYVAQTKSIKGSKQINGGCYGNQAGEAMILAGCLTSEIKFDKGLTYSWDKLAQKCQGISGICAVTNGLWTEHLKCCTKRTGVTSVWDKHYKVYEKANTTSTQLSGPAIMLIVLGGVAFMMALIHFGAKARESAKRTALLREQEATDDYEEIMTPLTGIDKVRPPGGVQRSIGPSSIEVSLHEGDKIFRKKEEEVLYEGEMF